MEQNEFTTPYPIVICEGPDCAGKSTLINRLMERHPNCCYVHNAVADDIYKLHSNTMKAARIIAQTHWVFIDRLHLSEEIYGTVFRGGPAYDIAEFDREIVKPGNVKKILCMVDKETSLAKHAERIDKEMFDDISKVWDMYNNVSDISWVRYNWKEDDIDLDTLEIAKKNLTEKTHEVYNGADVCGRLREVHGFASQQV